MIRFCECNEHIYYNNINLDYDTRDNVLWTRKWLVVRDFHLISLLKAQQKIIITAINILSSLNLKSDPHKSIPNLGVKM